MEVLTRIHLKGFVMIERAGRRLPAVFFLLACASAAGVAWGQAADLRARFGTRSLEAANKIQQSMELQAAGKLKDARAALDAAAKLDPACDFLFYRQAGLLCDMGEMDLAMAAYQKAYDLGKADANSITMDAAISAGITCGELKKFDEANAWFSKAIVADPLDRNKLLWKAYRNLAIALLNQKRYGDAALAAVNGRERSPEHVEAGLVETCIKQAREAGDTEALRGLFFTAKLPPPAARGQDLPLTLVALHGDKAEGEFSQILADPQGRWVVAVARGKAAYVLLTPEGATLKAAQVNAGGAVQSACLLNGHFYVVLDGPPRLAELDAVTGKSAQTWPLPVAANSVAVFPGARVAYFPNKDVIWSLNLKTGAVASTGKGGQMVVGHPNETTLFSRVKDENDIGHTSILNIDGHQVIVTEESRSMMPTTLLEYFCAGEQLVVAGVREAASSNGYDVVLSPDGRWVGMPGGGGWRSDFAMAQKLSGYVVPVFAAGNLAQLQGVFAPGGNPTGLAFNPVTGQVAAVCGADARLAGVATATKQTQTLPGPFRGAAAWSGDGRFLVLAGNSGLIAYANPLSKEEAALGATWWRKIGPEKSAAAPAVAARVIAPVAALTTFQPTAQVAEVRKAFAAAQKAGGDGLPAWESLAAYTVDKETAAAVAEIQKDKTSSKGTRLFRLKELAKANAAYVPLNFFLADAYLAADQAEAGRALLLGVIHSDKGQTELTVLALDRLAGALADAKQPVQAAHCVAVAYGLDRGSAETLALVGKLFPAAGLATEAQGLKAEGGGGGAALPALPALKSLPADAAALSATALYARAARSVVLIKCGDGSGSGACVGDGQTIVTSLHVVAEGEAITVYPFVMKEGKAERGEAVRARVVAREPREDLAILRVEKALPGLTPMFVAAKNPPGGQKVYAVGNPGLADQTLDLTMTDGIISATDRMIDGKMYLQHTAGVNPGNSGGPLINERGELVGVVCMTATLKSVNFATPASVVQALFAKEKP